MSVVGIAAGGRTGQVQRPVATFAVSTPFETVRAGIAAGGTVVSTVTPIHGGGRQGGTGNTGPSGSGTQAKTPGAGATALTTMGATALVNQRRPVAGSKVMPVTVPGGIAAGTSTWASGAPGRTGMSDTIPAAFTTQSAPGTA